MKKTVITYALIICFSLISVVGNAKDTTRLIMATKGEHVAFFLPLFHIPSMIEKDDYKVNVVEKVFQRASVIYDESAHKSHIYSNAALPCANNEKMKVSTRKKLHKKYLEIKAFDAYVFPAPWIINEIEFAELMLIILGPVEPIISKMPKEFLWHEGQITTVLAHKFDVQVNSIESMIDFHKSYCDLTIAEKEDLVADVIKGSRDLIISEPRLSQEYAKALLEIKKALNDPAVCQTNKCQSQMEKLFDVNAKEGTAKFFQNDRNKLWLKKINEVQNTSHVPFYGLGAKHFYPNKNGPGLIGMLKGNGFSLRIIKNLDEVPKNILTHTSN